MGTTILVSHDLNLAAEHCDRVAIIQAGSLAALGTVNELKQAFAGRPILEIHTPAPVRAMNLLDAMPEVEKTSIFGTAVHAVLKDPSLGPDSLRQRLTSGGIEVSGTSLVEPSLEDVFLDVAERGAA